MTSKILIVDDIADNRDLLVDTLRFADCQTVAVASVEEAQEILADDSDISLILSDVNLGSATAYDLAAWKKLQNPRIAEMPLLMISSEVLDSESRTRGLVVGAVDYISRPIASAELVARVKGALDNFKRYVDLRQSFEDSQGQVLAGQMIAASTHEMGNLAQLVVLNVDVLGNNAHELNNDALETLNSVRFAAQTLATVTRSMSSMFTPQSCHCTNISLAKLVQSVVKLAVPLCKPFQIQFDERAFANVEVYADSAKLTQILVNFVLNAAESIRQSGREDGWVRFEVELKGDGLCQIMVRDNGIGLPTAEERHEFKPFRSTRVMKGGSGLGLWLSAKLAALMQGRMWLSSSGPGGGALAIIELKCID